MTMLLLMLIILLVLVVMLLFSAAAVAAAAAADDDDDDDDDDAVAAAVASFSIHLPFRKGRQLGPKGKVLCLSEGWRTSASPLSSTGTDCCSLGVDTR